ncbi:MAG: hypothetical protein JXR97_17350 [Planctomycetes bacterium]|nr:hypothetical protein [Planctomycetota bacterium]
MNSCALHTDVNVGATRQEESGMLLKVIIDRINMLQYSMIGFLLSIITLWIVYLWAINPRLKEHGINTFTESAPWTWRVNVIGSLLLYRRLCSKEKANAIWFYIAVLLSASGLLSLSLMIAARGA